MLKKSLSIVLLSSLILSNLSADVKSNVENLLIDTFKQDVKAVKSKKLPLINNMEFIIIEDKKTKQWMPILSNTEGTLLMPFSTNMITKDVKKLELETLINELNEHNKPIIEKLAKEEKEKAKISQEKLKKVMDKEILSLLEKDKTVIKQLQNGKKDNVTLLLDPTCRFCVEKVNSNFSEFKDKNINIVFVGVLGQEAVKRAANLEKQWDDKKTFDEKMVLLKKYFDRNNKLTSEEEKVDDKKIVEFLDKLAKVELSEEYNKEKFLGNYGVPYIILH